MEVPWAPASFDIHDRCRNHAPAFQSSVGFCGLPTVNLQLWPHPTIEFMIVSHQLLPRPNRHDKTLRIDCSFSDFSGWSSALNPKSDKVVVLESLYLFTHNPQLAPLTQQTNVVP
ncbi:hypothetical protein Zmor_017595 [Zophobas morio]|uniref:Uncharacterized protein n=1 Tax=Zophobas morio TaxID=2755281 RepID=A0AA38MCQ6_9CUCU|nr:hypothetical protein Zmor_017595 [Zophobas morio]